VGSDVLSVAARLAIRDKMTTEDSMTDNVLQTLQQLVQDVIAPDVRELKVRQASCERLVDERFNSQAKSLDERFNSLTKEMDMRFSALEECFTLQARQSEIEFKTLMSAIPESKAQTDLAGVREFSDLRERIAVIESKLAAKAS
jgi:hypothetical protein